MIRALVGGLSGYDAIDDRDDEYGYYVFHSIMGVLLTLLGFEFLFAWAGYGVNGGKGSGGIEGRLHLWAFFFLFLFFLFFFFACAFACAYVMGSFARGFRLLMQWEMLLLIGCGTFPGMLVPRFPADIARAGACVDNH